MTDRRSKDFRSTAAGISMPVAGRGGTATRQRRPRLGVVVPTYNRPELLRRAIESVLAQTLAPAEIVVVDDGSAEDTATVARAFGSAVTLLSQENRGVASARNAGVAHLDSAFIAFLDDDDIWAPGHLERMSEAIERTDGTAAVYFSDLAVDVEGARTTVWEMAGFSCAGSWELCADGADWALLPRQPIAMQAAVVRRDAYVHCGGQAESLSTREDTHLFFKLFLGGSVCAVRGVAGELLADAAEARLTAIHHDDEAYWRATAWLYADILERAPWLDRDDRRELGRRASAAHLRLAHLALVRRDPSALIYLARGIRQDPGFARRRAQRFAKRGAVRGPAQSSETPESQAVSAAEPRE